jgi:hypothetical protein
MIYDLLFLLLLAGCSQPRSVQRPPAVEPARTTEPNVAQPREDTAKVAPPAGGPAFTPVKIGILPLTELSSPSDASQSGKLSVFVTLLDAFGSQMKAPGVLRFELYEYVPRSAQAKGQRLTLWPTVDLTSPAQNNRYWRDFLRAYEFVLDTGSPTQNSALGGPTQAGRDKTYILEVTCMYPDGRRLSSEYVLKNSP